MISPFSSPPSKKQNTEPVECPVLISGLKEDVESPTKPMQDQQQREPEPHPNEGEEKQTPFDEIKLNTELPQSENEKGSNSMMYTYFPCKHDTISVFGATSFCKHCGIRMNKSKTTAQALKSTDMKYIIHASPLRIYKNIYQDTSKRVEVSFSNHDEYLKQRDRAITYVRDLSERMKISKQPVFLSIMYLDILCTSEDKSDLCDLKIKEHVNLYAAVCLMLAIKSVELDERIPFLSTMKNYIQLSSYSKEDIKKAERKAVDTLKFHMHLPNLFDLLQYYGSQGIVFLDDKQRSAVIPTKEVPSEQVSDLVEDSNRILSNEGVKEKESTATTIAEIGEEKVKANQEQNEQCESKETKEEVDDARNDSQPDDKKEQTSNSNSLEKLRMQLSKAQSEFDENEISFFKFYDIISKIEKDLSRMAFFAISEKKFYEYDLETLGAAIVCYLREKYNLSNPFRQEILEISSVSLSSVQECSKLFLSKLDIFFKHQQPASFLTGASYLDYLLPKSKLSSSISTSNSRSTLDIFSSNRQLQENKKPFDNSGLSSFRNREYQHLDQLSNRIMSSFNSLGQSISKIGSSNSTSTRTRNFGQPSQIGYISSATSANNSHLSSGSYNLNISSQSSYSKPPTSFLTNEKTSSLSISSASSSSASAGFIALQNSINRSFPLSSGLSSTKNQILGGSKAYSNPYSSALSAQPIGGIHISSSTSSSAVPTSATTTSGTVTGSKETSAESSNQPEQSAPSTSNSQPSGIIEDSGKQNNNQGLQKAISSTNIKQSSFQAHSFLNRKQL